MRLRDLWTVLPPSEVSAADLNAIRNACPDFTPGWLSDLVRVDIYTFSIPTPKVHNFVFLIPPSVGNRIS